MGPPHLSQLLLNMASVHPKQKHGDRVLGEVAKNSFNCFARQRGPQWANALKTVGSTLESCCVQGAGCDQLLDSSWIDWHQGEVSSIINLLVSNSLGVYVLVVSSFHLPVKTT